MLSSVYYKPPENFVKRIRDRINERLDLENDETTVLCDWSWGDTNIFSKDDDGNERYKTIEEIGEDIGMGDWADYDEMIDDIREDCNKLVFSNCGFGIWWDDQHPDMKD